jgi:putative ABC transport system ATP-binding protein
VVGSDEQILLIGESGSGKTTLLHLIGGLLRNYTGSIAVEGKELSSMSERALDTFRGKTIGFVFQKNHLINALNVEDNVRLSPYLAGSPPDGDRLATVLDQLGLHSKRKSRPSELSHGQAQSRCHRSCGI